MCTRISDLKSNCNKVYGFKNLVSKYYRHGLSNESVFDSRTFHCLKNLCYLLCIKVHRFAKMVNFNSVK